MKSVLITGIAGYLGSVLARELLSEGYRVIGLDNFMYDNWFSVKDLLENPRIKIIEGDVRDLDAIEKLSEEDIDSVVHLAAIVGDPACGVYPETAVKVNYDGTLALAESMMRRGLDLFLFFSTCSVYGTNKSPKIDEDGAVKPVSLYAWTKVLAERGLKRLETRGLPLCVLRFATAYGLSPRPRFDLVVNHFALKAVQDAEITVYGGNQYRPFIHVRDIARAVSLCLNNPEKARGETLNVGNDEDNYTISQLAQIVKSVIPSVRIKTSLESVDDRSYRVNFEKIMETLNYRGKMTIEDGVREIKESLESGYIQNPKLRAYYNMTNL